MPLASGAARFCRFRLQCHDLVALLVNSVGLAFVLGTEACRALRTPLVLQELGAKQRFLGIGDVVLS